MTQFVLAVVLGAVFAFGTFLVLRRDVVRVVWGVVLMSQGANVFLVTMGGVRPGTTAPIVHEGGGSASVDPLVQALVLTAIVIGFGTTAFALVLTYRVYQEHGTIDLGDEALARDTGGPADAVGPASEELGGATAVEADGGAVAEVAEDEDVTARDADDGGPAAPTGGEDDG